jgi:hypothetical protein
MPDPVAVARKKVDALNKEHYRLLAAQTETREQMSANSAELADAVQALHDAEQQAAAASRPDLSGAVEVNDPPPTVVQLGVAEEKSEARNG